MADEYLPPVVATLAADITAYSAMLTEAQARMEAFVAASMASMAELDARMASVGAAGAAAGAETAGAGAAGAGAADASAVVAADSEIVDANERATISTFTLRDAMAEVGASAEVMAATTAQAMGTIEAQTAAMARTTEEMAAKATAANEAVGASMEGTAAKSEVTAAAQMEQYKKVGTAVGLAGAAVAAVTIKMAGDFEQSTTRLVTSAGETQSNLDSVRQGVLDMTSQVGYGAEELSKALYTIESGGQHGADGLKVLQAAAEGAKTENADLKTVADAVTSVMVDYHLKAEDAAMVTSKLVAATSQGKTTFQELSGSMAQVLPVASAAHVSLDDILGDLSSMTVHGMSAEQSAQNLTDVIRHMQNPTAVQSKELAILGMNSQDLADKLSTKGLSGTLQEISARITNFIGPGATKAVLDLGTALNGLPKEVQDLGGKLLEGSISAKEFSKAAMALDPIAKSQAMSFASLAGSTHTIGTEQVSNQAIMQTYGAAMAKATGDATGLRTALMLTGENANVTNNAIKVIGGTSTEAGGHVQGWAEIQATFNQQMSEAKAGLGALAIEIGQKLLPVASEIARVIADGAKWMSEHKEVAGVLAVVVGGVLVVAFSALLAVFWGFAANPVTWIIAAIIAVIALLAVGVYELITHWGDIVNFFTGIWNSVKDAFGAAIGWITNLVGGWIDDIKALPGKAAAGLASLGEKIGKIASDAWHAFIDFVARGGDAVIDLFTHLPQRAGYALGFLVGTVARVAVDAVTGFVNSLKRGWDNIVQWFKDLPDNIKAMMAEAYIWLKGPGMKMLTGFLDAIEQKWKDLGDWFNALPGKIGDFFKDAYNWLFDKAVDVMRGFLHGITQAYHDVDDWCRRLPSNVMNFFSDAGKWLVDTGSNILHGLWDGISNGASWLWDQITGFANNIIQGFKDAFGVHSPSVIFAGIGGHLMDGLSQGIVDKTSQAVTAAQRAASKVVDAAGGQFSVNGAVNLAANPATFASGLGGTTGGGTTVNLYVGGSLIQQTELKKYLQDIFLQHAGRNVGNGLGQGTAVRV